MDEEVGGLNHGKKHIFILKDAFFRCLSIGHKTFKQDILGRKMKLLITNKDFHKWAKEEGFQPGLGLTKKEAIEIGIDWTEKKNEQDNWFSKNAPKKYPCVGYSQVVSFGMEEIKPMFLYEEDLSKFLREIEKICL